MYFVNLDQIEARLQYLPVIEASAEALTGNWIPEDLIYKAALERIVHVALEAVTDIGSLLIDGFIMRDASSYEDIVSIMLDEGVVQAELADFCVKLVRMRRPLVQDYLQVNMEELLGLAKQLPRELSRFADGVRAFIHKEMK